MTTTGPSRNCPLLERPTPSKQLPYPPAPWVLNQCQESGFVYVDNPPAYEAFTQEFAWEVTSARQAQDRKAAEPMLHAVSSGLKRFRHHVMKRNKVRDLTCATVAKALARPQSKSDTIHMLDVGCGWGGMLQDVMDRLPADLRPQCAAHGIELSKELAQISHERLRASGGSCVQDTALDGMLPFAPEHFEVTVLSSFLEHEINPLPLLRRCRERLRVGGHVIVKVPNFDGFHRKLRGKRWPGFRWPDHVNYFTPHTLSTMAVSAGLRVARMSFWDASSFSDSLYAVLAKPRASETAHD
jgi:2-polyprenyl-3-methyl-5-hydroxy-6-metoxy-1,4-benzoquinol methylase